VNNAILAAARRARVFQRTELLDPFSSPPDWQSALREYQERRPRPPPSTVIAVHPSTDASEILRRFLAEDDHRRLVERDRKRRWRAARSSEQVGRDRARDRQWRRIKRAGRRSAPSAG
jgi:hypothetical protein